jgi:hypothetical protein
MLLEALQAPPEELPHRRRVVAQRPGHLGGGEAHAIAEPERSAMLSPEQAGDVFNFLHKLHPFLRRGLGLAKTLQVGGIHGLLAEVPPPLPVEDASVADGAEEPVLLVVDRVPLLQGHGERLLENVFRILGRDAIAGEDLFETGTEALEEIFQGLGGDVGRGAGGSLVHGGSGGRGAGSRRAACP